MMGPIGQIQEIARLDQRNICDTSSESMHTGTSVSLATTGQYGGRRSQFQCETEQSLADILALYASLKWVTGISKHQKGELEESASYLITNRSDWGTGIESEISLEKPCTDVLKGLKEMNSFFHGKTPQPHGIIRMQNTSPFPKPSEVRELVRKQKANALVT